MLITKTQHPSLNSPEESASSFARPFHLFLLLRLCCFTFPIMYVFCDQSCLLQSPFGMRLIRHRNSTNTTFYTPPSDTFWGNYNEISQYNQKLNVLELLWASWYAYMQNDVLATGIMSFVMHEFVYFGRSLPWFIIGYIPFFDKYKIQGVSSSVNSGRKKN